jgi:hypothetical protein
MLAQHVAYSKFLLTSTFPAVSRSGKQCPRFSTHHGEGTLSITSIANTARMGRLYSAKLQYPGAKQRPEWAFRGQPIHRCSFRAETRPLRYRPISHLDLHPSVPRTDPTSHCYSQSNTSLAVFMTHTSKTDLLPHLPLQDIQRALKSLLPRIAHQAADHRHRLNRAP